MSLDWIAIALGDVAWITLAFMMGLGARLIGLPPLIGFLATGFLLSTQGIVTGDVLQKLVRYCRARRDVHSKVWNQYSGRRFVGL